MFWEKKLFVGLTISSHPPMEPDILSCGRYLPLASITNKQQAAKLCSRLSSMCIPREISTSSLVITCKSCKHPKMHFSGWYFIAAHSKNNSVMIRWPWWINDAATDIPFFLLFLEASTISLYASAPPPSPLYLGDTLMSSSYGHLQDWPKILPKLEYLPKY